MDLASGTSTGLGQDTLANVESAQVESDTADLLIGSSADNVFFSGAGRDVERGFSGDDVFLASAGADRAAGGPGRDSVDFSRTYAGATVNLPSGIAHSASTDTDRFVGIEDVVGSEAGDVITGDESNNVLRGVGGEDILRGGAGDDVIRGGANSQELDRVDQLSGGPGDDVIDGSDVDLKPQQDMRDQVNYGTSETSVVVDLATGTATGEGTDTLVNVEDVLGSVHDDVLRGDAGPNELNGSAGDDVYLARAGDDELEAGLGDDLFNGGLGTDVLQFSWPRQR